MNSFQALDYVIFIAVFIGSVGIGVYHGVFGGRQDSPGSYLLGDRQMKLVPVTLSMIVSLLSGNTLLGTPAETYGYGINIGLKVFTTTIGALIAAFLFVPILYPLKLLSVNHYLEMRFRCVYVRRLGCTLLLISQVLYIGCVMVGAAVTLETGLQSWAAMIVVSAVGTIYTTVGGLKGVIWTDVFQSLIMLVGIMAVLILGVTKVGSLGEVWNINREWQRTTINTSASLTDRMNILGFILGYTFPWIALYGINQTHVQRYNSMPSKSKAIWSIVLNPPGFAVFHLMALFIGMVMFAYYTKEGCDPISSNKIANPNQLLAYFVLDIMNFPGLPGAFVSALMCAALSSQTSSLNSMAAVLWDDFFAYRLRTWPKAKQAKFVKISVIFFGILCGIAGYVILMIGGNLQQLAASLPSNVLGPMLGLFLLGLFIPFANRKGALIGGVAALAINLWILIGQIINKQHRTKLPLATFNCTLEGNITTGRLGHWEFTANSTTVPTISEDTGLHGPVEWIYSISFLWFGCIGTLVTLIIGTIVSALTGGIGDQRIPAKLLAPGVRNLFGVDDIEEKIQADEKDEKAPLDVTDV